MNKNDFEAQNLERVTECVADVCSSMTLSEKFGALFRYTAIARALHLVFEVTREHYDTAFFKSADEAAVMSEVLKRLGEK